MKIKYRKRNSQFTSIRTAANYAQANLKAGDKQGALERLDGCIEDARALRGQIVADLGTVEAS